MNRLFFLPETEHMCYTILIHDLVKGEFDVYSASEGN